jgi:hypothetical protein
MYGIMKKAVIIYNGFIKIWNREVRAVSFLWFSPYLSRPGGGRKKGRVYSSED